MISMKKVSLFSFLSLSPLFIYSDTARASTLVASPFVLDFGEKKPPVQTPCVNALMIDFPQLEKYMTENRLSKSAPDYAISDSTPIKINPTPKKRIQSLTWIDRALMDFQLDRARFLHTHTVQDLGSTLTKAKNLMQSIYREMLDTYRPEYPITPESRAAAYHGKRKLFAKTHHLMKDTERDAKSTLSDYYDGLIDDTKELSTSQNGTSAHNTLEKIREARLPSNVMQLQYDLVNETIFDDFTKSRTVPAIWNRLAEMYVCYENFSSLYWGVEEVLFDELTHGTKRGNDLWQFWHIEGQGTELRKSMAGFMKRHFMVYAVKDERASIS
ncbi:MAG: hypothetical protein H2057_02040 [Alphaproteobacteria bacterium]|nr:hypothetical protein [Alphaproteobacteria bacterium]